MKSILHSAVALSALLAAVPTLADPFTARPLPAGFSVGTAFNNGAMDPYMVHEAKVADFLGNGHLQWYAGGSNISAFPEGGITALPAITPPGGGSATLRPLAGIPCDVDRDGDMDIVRVIGSASGNH